MKLRAAVLRRFKEPLEIEAREVPRLSPGEVLAEVRAAGVCGSDVHIWGGEDPRVTLPRIPGHEGAGVVVDLGGERRDMRGERVEPGDPVVWDRGRYCGLCRACAVERRPALCPERRVFGILEDGNYATHLVLTPRTALLKLPRDPDFASLAAATCSGATAAHALEYAPVREGDLVAVFGPGPLGLFAAALAARSGAREVVMVGTARGRPRLEAARGFGVTRTVCVADGTAAGRLDGIRALTGGRGADVVIECAGTAEAMLEAVRWTAPGGTAVLAGLARPVPPVPLDLYADVVRRNVRIQGLWASDSSHLYRAVSLVLAGVFPFASIVTHRLPLERATDGIAAAGSREAFKAVLLPR